MIYLAIYAFLVIINKEAVAKTICFDHTFIVHNDGVQLKIITLKEDTFSDA
jgi:hypothetical protein